MVFDIVVTREYSCLRRHGSKTSRMWLFCGFFNKYWLTCFGLFGSPIPLAYNMASIISTLSTPDVCYSRNVSWSLTTFILHCYIVTKYVKSFLIVTIYCFAEDVIFHMLDKECELLFKNAQCESRLKQKFRYFNALIRCAYFTIIRCRWSVSSKQIST
jgi:hypothetical protein